MGKDSELLIAARNGNVQVVEKLLSTKKSLLKGSLSARLALRKTADVNCRDAKNGETPLHNAALNQHLTVVELLLQHGALPNITDNKGCSPLHLAAWNGSCDIACALITTSPAVPDVNSKNVDGDTPLGMACQYGHTSVVKLLLQFHADPVLRNIKEESSLDLAAMYGRLDTVCCLIDSCPDLLQQGSLHHTPLHLAARNGHRDVVRRLLQAGFNINAKTTIGTALHEAALFGKQETVRLLLASGIDFNETDGSGKTVLELLRSQRSQTSVATKQIIDDFIVESLKRKEVAANPEGNLSAVRPGKNDDTGIYDFPAVYASSKLTGVESSAAEGIYDTPSSLRLSCNSPNEAGSGHTSTDWSSSAADDNSIDEIYDRPRKTCVSPVKTNDVHLTTAQHEQPAHQVTSPQSISDACVPPEGSCPPLPPPRLCQPPSEPHLRLPSQNQPTAGPSKPPRKKSDKDAARSLHFKDEMLVVNSGSSAESSVSPGEYVVLRQPGPWSMLDSSTPRIMWQRGDSGGGCDGGGSSDFANNSNIGAASRDNRAASSPRLHCKPASQTASTSLIAAGLSRPVAVQGVSCSSSIGTSGVSIVSRSGATSVHAFPKQSSAVTMSTDCQAFDTRGPSADGTVASNSGRIASEVFSSSLDDGTELATYSFRPGAALSFCPDHDQCLVDNSDCGRNLFCGLRKGSTSLLTHQSVRQRESRLPHQRQRSRTIAALRQRSYQQRFSSEGMLQQQSQEADAALTPLAKTLDPSPEPVASGSAEDEYEEWKQIATLVSSYGGRLSISFSLGNETDFGKLLCEMDNIKSIGDWLAGFGMAQYENVLIANGFDNTDFLGGNILEEVDLHLMGITDSADVAVILEHCLQLTLAPQIGGISASVECDDTLQSREGQATPVSEWLESLQLSQYADLFFEQASSNVDRNVPLWELDLSPILSIALRGHQKRILASLKIIREGFEALQGENRKEKCTAVHAHAANGDRSMCAQARVPGAACDAVRETGDSSASSGTRTPVVDVSERKPPTSSLNSADPAAQDVTCDRSGLKDSQTLSSTVLPVQPEVTSDEGCAMGGLNAAEASHSVKPQSKNVPTLLLLDPASSHAANGPEAHLSGNMATGVPASVIRASPVGAFSPAASSAEEVAGVPPTLSMSQVVFAPSTTSSSLEATKPDGACHADSTLSTAEVLAKDVALENFDECQWRHRPELLIKGCVNYNVVYLGTSVMSKADGIEATKEAIDSIKAATSSLPNLPTVALSISYKGVKFINTSSKEVVCEHDIGNIYCVSQHAEAMNFFAYSTKDHLSRKLYCHIFCVKSVELAREIILTLGEAFEVAYYAAMKSTEDTDQSRD